MKDEFNQSGLNEFNVPEEFPTADVNEFNSTNQKAEDFGGESVGSKRRKTNSKMKAYLMASALTIVSVTAIASTDVDEHSTVIVDDEGDEDEETDEPEETEDGETDEPEETEDGVTEKADAAFPVLNNLEPNGEAVGWGVVNEEFINTVAYDGVRYWIHKNPNLVYDVTAVDGISYDESTNTLTLDNFSGISVVANLMGNSFTIELKGDNVIESQLLVWGFYYGGSVTFTGDGTLTIGEDSTYREQDGLMLVAEDSPSCIMVNEGVTLDIYGTNSAIMVTGKTIENWNDGSDLKGLYYIGDLTLTGGVRSDIDYYYYGDNTKGITADYTVLDEDGNPSTHVIIK
ncbi:MAG: hypothetical protein K6F92_01130 [Lachnospiraceae bacterium]|nr:hypothetical protein [Lachnospiraceae bacterium]